MIKTLTLEKKNELNNLLSQIAVSLDITETQFKNLVNSYNAVGRYLEEDPEFKSFNPLVTPQGSLRLGTIIQPITEDGDIDVDLVFRLNGKLPSWTQKDIKTLVGPSPTKAKLTPKPATSSQANQSEAHPQAGNVQPSQPLPS